MDFSIKTIDAKTSIAAVKIGCLVVGVFENRKLSAAAASIDKNGAITAALKSGDLSGKPGTTLLLRGLQGIAAERVLLVGLGDDESIKDKHFTQAAQALVRVFGTLGGNDALLALPLNQIKQRDLAWAIGNLVLTARDNLYRSDSQKSKKEPAPTGVKKIAFALSKTDSTSGKQALSDSIALANGVELTKDLGNLSANVCTPTYLG